MVTCWSPKFSFQPLPGTIPRMLASLPRFFSEMACLSPTKAGVRAGRGCVYRPGSVWPASLSWEGWLRMHSQGQPSDRLAHTVRAGHGLMKEDSWAEIEFSIQVYKVLNNEYSAWLIYSVSIRLFLTPTVWYIIIRISQVLCAFIDLKTKTHTYTLACIYMDRSCLSASAHHPVILFQCKSLSTHNSRGLGTPAAIIS